MINSIPGLDLAGPAPLSFSYDKLKVPYIANFPLGWKIVPVWELLGQIILMDF